MTTNLDRFSHAHGAEYSIRDLDRWDEERENLPDGNQASRGAVTADEESGEVARDRLANPDKPTPSARRRGRFRTVSEQQRTTGATNE